MNQIKLPPSLTTVTTFSKWLALYLFILLPSMGFYFGMEYQKIITISNSFKVDDMPQLKISQPVTPVKNSDWQTYTNQEDSFSFQHPSDMKMDIATGIGGNSYIFSNSQVKIEIYRQDNNPGDLKLIAQNYISDIVNMNSYPDELLSPRLVYNCKVYPPCNKSAYQISTYPLSNKVEAVVINSPYSDIYLIPFKSSVIWATVNLQQTLEAKELLDKILSTIHDSSQTTSDLSPQDFMNQLPLMDPGVTWQEAIRSSYEVDTDKVMNFQVNGIMRSGEESFNGTRPGDPQQIIEKLTQEGWNNFTIADSPTSSGFTYTKTIQGKQRVVQIDTYLLGQHPSDDPQDPPVTCPCNFKIEVFYSDPF